MTSYAVGGVQAKPEGIITREAATDLSSYQYHAMNLNTTDGQVELGDSSASDAILGILQNKPEAEGEEAELATEGTSLLVVDGSSTPLTIGCFVGSDSSGHGVKVTADKALYFAIALEASSASGDLIEVKLVGLTHIAG